MYMTLRSIGQSCLPCCLVPTSLQFTSPLPPSPTPITSTPPPLPPYSSPSLPLQKTHTHTHTHAHTHTHTCPYTSVISPRLTHPRGNLYNIQSRQIIITVLGKKMKKKQRCGQNGIRCMYVCMFVCMYVCMYVYMYVIMYP